MIFSSLLFLFWFMPIFFILYYICSVRNHTMKNVLLFIGSIIFYAWGEPKYLILILISILVNYFAGIAMNHFDQNELMRKVFLIAAVIFDVGMLVVFKYTNFLIQSVNQLFHSSLNEVSITLPLGISFYTFQIMSYVIDLYRRNIKVETSLLRLGTYLVMFPQLIAGPIVVYSKVASELKERKITLFEAEDGLRLFILGLGSKVLIANQAGALFDECRAMGFEHLSMPMAWLGMLAFTLQIYFDFNGYSLMAIGLGRMLGFHFSENFNHPYMATSITDFWRRWHITLSTWFREYLYIPLGGNRKGNLRTYINLFIVWSITGLWHGANWNFVIWGLFFYVLLMIEKLGFGKFLEKHQNFAHVYSLLAIGISWIIFAITDLRELGIYLMRLFSFELGTTVLPVQSIFYYMRNYGVILILGCFFSTPVFRNWYENKKDSIITTLFLFLIVVCSVAYLTDASYNPFLYFRF